MSRVTTPLAWRDEQPTITSPPLFDQASKAAQMSALQRMYMQKQIDSSQQETTDPAQPSVGPTDGAVVSPMDRMAQQSGILSSRSPITQKYGNRSSIEQFSGGVNRGTDFGAPRGTKIAVPPGEWKVVEAFSGANQEGSQNSQKGINRGYGNSVLVENTKTGEKLRFSHLRVGGVGVQPGQVVKGGSIIGETGATGNVWGQTGQHLDLEYYNTAKQIADIMSSPYAQYLFGG